MISSEELALAIAMLALNDSVDLYYFFVMVTRNVGCRNWFAACAQDRTYWTVEHKSVASSSTPYAQTC